VCECVFVRMCVRLSACVPVELNAIAADVLENGCHLCVRVCLLSLNLLWWKFCEYLRCQIMCPCLHAYVTCVWVGSGRGGACQAQRACGRAEECDLCARHMPRTMSRRQCLAAQNSGAQNSEVQSGLLVGVRAPRRCPLAKLTHPHSLMHSCC